MLPTSSAEPNPPAPPLNTRRTDRFIGSREYLEEIATDVTQRDSLIRDIPAGENQSDPYRVKPPDRHPPLRIGQNQIHLHPQASKSKYTQPRSGLPNLYPSIESQGQTTRWV
uniref:Uncharacterized protein n=1 Tax=Picea glauca TaxID=3330 RepID=A0A101LZK7_PICGL|nr:hypothetical protein ABT39_MTgene5284 [Picea glauca]QHR88859.1 hypothetical protein Q903MT_gene2878 [Picea sitchensis]